MKRRKKGRGRKRKMKNRIALILCFVLCICSFCSCTIENSDQENVNMIYMTAEEIDLTGMGHEGYFVMNHDGTFTPLATSFEGYQGRTDESSPERYLWFTTNDASVTRLIPTVTPNSKLVAVYNTNSVMPTSCTLEKYKVIGYTIGCHIYRDTDESLYICSTDGLSGSAAAETMSVVDDESEYKIVTINGSSELPKQNVDNNLKMLLGLEKDTYYEFQFYKGTKLRTLTTKADAQIMQSEEAITLNNLYEKTTEGYFVINLPDNLETGYYYIAGSGLFKYEAR